MKLLCITPTYGRPIELLQNSLACFYSQTYTNAVQIYVDDTFNGKTIRGDGFVFMQTSIRSSSLSIKHDIAVEYGEKEFGNVDGIVIWDDIKYRWTGEIREDMVAFWDSIDDDKKINITKYAHWTETGVVWYGDKPEVNLL